MRVRLVSDVRDLTVPGFLTQSSVTLRQSTPARHPSLFIYQLLLTLRGTQTSLFWHCASCVAFYSHGGLTGKTTQFNQQPWRCVTLNVVLLLNRLVPSNHSKLLHTWPLLRLSKVVGNKLKRTIFHSALFDFMHQILIHFYKTFSPTLGGHLVLKE